MRCIGDYPDLMIKEEVAEVLRCDPEYVSRIKELPKTPVGNGNGLIRWRKKDVINYLDSKREEVSKGDSKQKTGHRKMGISSLLSWEELQKTRLGYSG